MRSIVRILAPGVSKKSINLCLKNGPIPACFCLFLSFSHFNNANWKSIDDVLRIWTHGDRMEGEDDTTELRMPTKRASSLVGKKISALREEDRNVLKTIRSCQRDFSETRAVWPDLAIFCTLGNFLKPVVTITLPKLPTLFVKVSSLSFFVVKSFLCNFYRHLETFYWSHWMREAASEPSAIP